MVHTSLRVTENQNLHFIFILHEREFYYSPFIYAILHLVLVPLARSPLFSRANSIVIVIFIASAVLI